MNIFYDFHTEISQKTFHFRKNLQVKRNFLRQFVKITENHFSLTLKTFFLSIDNILTYPVKGEHFQTSLSR